MKQKTIMEKLQKMYIKLPAEIRSNSELKLFLSNENYQRYQADLLNRGILALKYPYLFGTNVPIIAINDAQIGNTVCFTITEK